MVFQIPVKLTVEFRRRNSIRHEPCGLNQGVPLGCWQAIGEFQALITASETVHQTSSGWVEYVPVHLNLGPAENLPDQGGVLAFGSRTRVDDMLGVDCASVGIDLDIRMVGSNAMRDSAGHQGHVRLGLNTVDRISIEAVGTDLLVGIFPTRHRYPLVDRRY